MNRRQPPRLATWLLDRLGYTNRNAALAGDLLEEFHSGRSRAWYWRQTAMVIANGVVWNAVVLHAYLKAILVGWTAQLLVAVVLWWFHAPPELHAAFWWKLILYLILQAAGVAFVRLVKRFTGGSESDLKRIFLGCANGPQKESMVLALVSAQTFGVWLLSYCLCQVVLIRFTLAALIGYETLWLLLWELAPALVPVPATGQLPMEVATPDQPAGPIDYPPYDLALPVALSDSRTITLCPETLGETVFAAADEELISAMFKNGTSLELLRRAIWLGMARNYGRPPTEPLTLSDLASLIEQAARTEHVEQALFDKPPETYWQRLRHRFGSRAA